MMNNEDTNTITNKLLNYKKLSTNSLLTNQNKIENDLNNRKQQIIHSTIELNKKSNQNNKTIELNQILNRKVRGTYLPTCKSIQFHLNPSSLKKLYVNPRFHSKTNSDNENYQKQHFENKIRLKNNVNYLTTNWNYYSSIRENGEVERVVNSNSNSNNNNHNNTIII
jgi:hypothetical protein